MKIRLMNDAGYGDMENVKFPVEVEAAQKRGYYSVLREELYRIGATPDSFEVLEAFAFAAEFCEVVE